MLRSYQSLYFSVYRWSFKLFGQGRLPKFKSLFNVSFLLLIVLTNTTLIMQLLVRSHVVTITPASGIVVLIGATLFLLFNHLVLLNNGILKRVNKHMAKIGSRNMNLCSLLLLINVIITSGLILFTAF